MEFGKFKDATSLFSGYLELEKAFTKKCTELSIIKKRLADKEKEEFDAERLELQNGKEGEISSLVNLECIKNLGQTPNDEGQVAKNVKTEEVEANAQKVGSLGVCNTIEGVFDGNKDDGSEDASVCIPKNAVWNGATAEELGANGVIKDNFKNVSASENFGLGVNEEVLENGKDNNGAVAKEERFCEALSFDKENEEAGKANGLFEKLNFNKVCKADDEMVNKVYEADGEIVGKVGLADGEIVGKVGRADGEIVGKVYEADGEMIGKVCKADGKIEFELNENDNDLAKVDDGKANFEGDKSFNYNTKWRRRVNEFFASNTEAVQFKKEIAKVLLADKSLIDRSDGLMLAYLLAKNNKDKSALPYKSLDKHGVAPTDASAKSDNISNFGNHNSSYDNYNFGSGFGTFNGDKGNGQSLPKFDRSALDEYFEGLLDIKQRSPRFVASENGGGIAISTPSKPRTINDAGKYILNNFF